MRRGRPKLLLGFIGAVVAATALAACGNGDDGNAPEAAPKTAAREP